MNPKVSVVVPIYGVEKYLRQCVDSILAQTLKEIEVILVDDGSPDGCPAIVDEYAARDSRVIAVHQENGGVSSARNKALSLACGEFVAFIDPDDLYYSDFALEHLYNAAVSNDSLIAGGKVMLFNDGEDPSMQAWSIPLFTNFPGYGVVEYRDFQSLNNFWCYIYKRKFLEEKCVLFPDLVQFEDPVFFVKIMIAARKFVALDEVVYLYRRGVHSDNHIGESARKLNDRVKGQLAVLKMAEEHQLKKLAEITVDYFLTTLKIQDASRHKIEPCCLKEFFDIVKKSAIVPFWKKSRVTRKLGLGLIGKLDRFKLSVQKKFRKRGA